jgi:hypothetical protein
VATTAVDWDNLILLDACRYDTFEELATDLPGELKKTESKAPATDPFLRANFSGKKRCETVYVTVNHRYTGSKTGSTISIG